MSHKKWNYVEDLIKRRPDSKASTNDFVMKLHGVSISWQSPSKFLMWQLKSVYKSFEQQSDDKKNEESWRIYWQECPEEYSDIDWGTDPNYECEIKRSDEFEKVVQRDFVALKKVKTKEIWVHYPLELLDGLYNFMRWWMPREMVKKGYLLLHSSCVLDKNKKAYFSLGPSGAGKTTISQLASPRTVLGDDMNIIGFSKHKIFAMAGSVGQMIEDPKTFGVQYDVGSLFWLKKSSEFQLNILNKNDAKLKLLSCCANLFWSYLTEEESLEILSFVDRIIEKVLFYELHFKKNPEVWNHVMHRMEADL